MTFVEQAEPGVVVSSDELLRAVAVLSALGAPEASLRSRSNALLVGGGRDGDEWCSVVVMVGTSARGVLAPIDVDRSVLEEAASYGRECHVWVVADTVRLDGVGFSVAVPGPRRPTTGPDLLTSRLGRSRSHVSIRPEHVGMLARITTEGAPGVLDGVVISPDGWAGTSSPQQLGVVPLLDATLGQPSVVPGRVFRAARAFGPDEVMLELDHRADGAPLARMVAFAGPDMLVVESVTLDTPAPDLRPALTDRAQPIVVVEDGRVLRSAIVRLLDGSRVRLCPGTRACVEGWDETGAFVSVPFEGWVREPVTLRADHLLDLLTSVEGRVELCCDDQRHQLVYAWSGEGTLRALAPLGPGGL